MSVVAPLFLHLLTKVSRYPLLQYTYFDDFCDFGPCSYCLQDVYGFCLKPLTGRASLPAKATEQLLSIKDVLVPKASPSSLWPTATHLRNSESHATMPTFDEVKDAFDTTVTYATFFVKYIYTRLKFFFEYLHFRIQRSTPAWLIHLIGFATKWVVFLSVLFAVTMLLGGLAYQTSLLCFEILGYVTPAQRRLFGIEKEDMQKEIDAMTFDEKTAAEKIVIQKETVDEEVKKAGTLMWLGSALFCWGFVWLGDDDVSWGKLATGVLCGVLPIMVLPLSAACICRAVVPKAYKSGAWLCEKAEGVEVPELKISEAPSTTGAADGTPKKSRYRLPKEAELTNEDYEVKRAGYLKRKPSSKYRGGLPTADELKMME